MKRLLLLVVLCAAPAAAAPRLLVVVSVDQMRADYLDRWAAEYRGGLKTLREGGAVLTGLHVHIPTETGPGHALILTGKFPDQTGIVGNEWWDRTLSTAVYCVYDSVHGLGPEHLLAYTLGDALKAKDPESKVVSLSVKDRAAILLGGKRPDAALWLDKSAGVFTTSSYYPRPSWLDSFNRSLRGRGGALAGTDARALGELLYTPANDRLLLGLVKEALRRFKLGRDAHPDLLAISFSGTDFIGHKYGPDSPQIHEQLLSLDAVLGELLEALRRRVGEKNFDLILTADHGVTPLPESPEGLRRGIRRVADDDLAASLEKALDERFPFGGPWILGQEYPNLYLDRSLAAKMRMDWSSLLRRAADALKTVPGVAQVYIPGEIDPAELYADVYRRSSMLGRSGDLLVRVSSGVVVTDHPTGTDHGTPYPDDSRVPLVFWGPDFKPGRVEEPAWVADLAPTGGVLLGVPFPPAAGARVLTEILK